MFAPRLYARHEPSTDSYLKDYLQPHQLTNKHRDVILYHDAKATQKAATIPWHQSKPKHNTKKINHNCCRYQLKWLEDAVKYPH